MSKRRLLLRIIDLSVVLLVYIGLTIIMNARNLMVIKVKGMIEISLILLLIYFITFELFRVYKPLWRYASQTEYLTFVVACIIAGSIVSIISMTVQMYKDQLVINLLCTSLNTLILVTIRLFYHVRLSKKPIIQNSNKDENITLIIGGGWSGRNILPQLKEKGSDYNPIGFIDDNLDMKNRSINGVPVIGTTNEIKKVCKEYKVKTILFAIPSCDEVNKKRILNLCFETQCELKTIPFINEILSGAKSFNTIEDVKIEDLLGRDPMVFNDQEIYDYIKNKVCLVTGGGGSIGSELCRQIAKFNPKKLLVIDIYENTTYEIQQELIRNYREKLDLEVEIFSVCDLPRLEIFFKKYKPEIVFHAAAHKHVPFMEDTPEEAIKNNVVGTYNTAFLAKKYKTKKFILVSTDKAVRPTNIMGASKRICEKTIRLIGSKDSNTEFAAVRFGNVLGSNGSVIPLFKKQIENGGPVTVTHKDIIRYFMTIPEAVSLVMQAGALAKGGEVFVLDMGEPVKIYDLAMKLIKLSGYIPNKDIKIEFTGLRPGEKLFEELLLASEGISKTKNKKIFIGKQKPFDLDIFSKNLDKLIFYAKSNNIEKVYDYTKMIVTSFNHKKLKKAK